MKKEIKPQEAAVTQYKKEGLMYYKTDCRGFRWVPCTREEFEERSKEKCKQGE